MANCSNCSAPMPYGSNRCDYCGGFTDIDLKGIHYFTTNKTESERICPRCGISLSTIDLTAQEKFYIERCEVCLGLFFDPNELEALLEGTVTNVFSIDRDKLDCIRKIENRDERGAFYIKCPVCAKIMNRVNFGTNSGVIVDRCREHGVWLDGGELRRLFDWMKAGGKLLQQQRDDEQGKIEMRELERQNRKLQAQSRYDTTFTEESGYGLFGGDLRKSDPDLFDIVTRAIGFFIK
ncbi:MAG: zf-TFIIB domain-containing protein [Desulfuromonadaceae bacterium]|nr:zf-TFIIB domain-containing protein [Desulfuromonadaceae bacterium]MDD2854210.1 zf-TFIIB domain-containing protein [Desulfuromonadaceae bacterium]